MAVGGVVLAGMLIGFTNPKTVHAVTAALVQVTNTASNPVVTQGVGQQAGNLVHLVCLSDLDLNANGCAQYLPDGEIQAFTVPSGQSLVVNAVDAYPVEAANCTGNPEIELQGAYGHIAVQVANAKDNNMITIHQAYPAGVVISAGTSPKVRGILFGAGGSAMLCPGSSETLEVYGYLTAS